jgi:hypothetical protein
VLTDTVGVFHVGAASALRWSRGALIQRVGPSLGLGPIGAAALVASLVACPGRVFAQLVQLLGVRGAEVVGLLSLCPSPFDASRVELLTELGSLGLGALCPGGLDPGCSEPRLTSFTIRCETYNVKLK